MPLQTLRIDATTRDRWHAEAVRLGVSVSALIRAAVDERIAAAGIPPATTEVHGVDGTAAAVAHGTGIVIVTVGRPGRLGAWVGDIHAARALAAMLLHQAATTGSP